MRSYSAAIRTPRLRLLLMAAAAAVVSGLLYTTTLTNPFVYDDYATVLQNPTIDQLGDPWSVMKYAPARPLINLSYAVDRALWGPGPFGFHVTNVLLHMLNVMLLFAMARRAALDVGQRSTGAASTSSPDATAAAAALLFAVHPMMSESVGYISARAELFAGTFVLLCLLSAARWMRKESRSWWVAAFGCWIGALLSKEVAIVLPLVLIAYDRWLLASDPATHERRFLRLHLPMLSVAFVVSMARLYVMSQMEYVGEVRWYWPLVPVQLDAMRRYLELLVVPHHQAIYHGASSVGLFDPRALAIPVLLAVAVVISTRRHAGRLATFGLIAFVLFLIPSSMLYVLNIGEVMAEHRAYVASIGIFLGFGSLIGWLTSQLHLVGKGARRFAWVALALVAVQLAALTVARNRVWSNPEALWREAVNGAPDDWLPNAQLAESLRQRDSCGEAVTHYQRALLGRPEETYLLLIYSRMGACQLRLKRFADASRTFSMLSGVAPRSAEGPLGLALVSIARKDGKDPRPQLRTALRRDPANIGVRQLLVSLEEPDNPAEALRLCQEIKDIAPSTAGVDACVERNTARVRGGQ